VSPRILHLSTYDANGGAARAAYALHRAMVAEGLDSTMRVAVKTLDDPTVQGPPPSRFGKFARAQFADRQLWKLQKSPRQTWRSPARFSTIKADEINSSPYDVINLHWVTDGFLSIKEIGKIEKPIVWSLYDMWPFAGTEHYGADEPNARWRWGYTKANRPVDESGFDLDRSTWELKSKLWTRPMTVVPASSWLEESVKSSALMRHWPITRIPHVVDCDVFAPMDMNEARTKLGLPIGVPLILFLASAGIHDRRKGWDLLDEALVHVRKSVPEVEVVIVGPSSPGYESTSGAKLHWRGSIRSDEALRLHYCAADVTVVPSREDNMPLTAMEAQSCGRPVAAFRLGGLSDIVAHTVSGRLAVPFDTESLAGAVETLFESSTDSRRISDAARSRSTATWSSHIVVTSYLSAAANLPS
jgi:glycosyltransferase involved in cell wall biosynthesis